MQAFYLGIVIKTVWYWGGGRESRIEDTEVEPHRYAQLIWQSAEAVNFISTTGSGTSRHPQAKQQWRQQQQQQTKQTKTKKKKKTQKP